MAQNSHGFKNGWYLIALLLLFGLAGSAAGELISQSVSALSFIGRNLSIGMDNPVVLDLHFIKLTFGVSLRVSIASLAGMIVGFFIYRKL